MNGSVDDNEGTASAGARPEVGRALVTLARAACFGSPSVERKRERHEIVDARHRRQSTQLRRGRRRAARSAGRAKVAVRVRDGRFAQAKTREADAYRRVVV